MYKHSFTLLQHSPLVHHLGIEGWSGLQVKAVSPMLNTYIVEKISGFKENKAKTEFIKLFKNSCIYISEKNWNAGRCNSCEKIDCKFTGWFRNKKEIESLAFNYDLNFTCEVDMEASYKQKIINQEHAHILYKERKITGDIICTSTSLKDRIISFLPEFFALTGFGYRSSKGYGSFSLEETTEVEYQGILHSNYNACDQIVFCHNTSGIELSNQISRIIIEECKNFERKNLPPNLPYNRRKEKYVEINSKYRGFGLDGTCEFNEIKNSKYPSVLINSKNDKIQVPEEVMNISLNSKLFYKSIQEIIDQHWKWIKSGTNYPYYKSLLWQYFCGQHGNKTGWEKRFIKESLKINHNSVFTALKKNDREGPMRFETKDQPNDYQFYRALLGLAEHYEFASYGDKINIQVKSEDPKKIERIPSPVKFKVFGDSIYLIVDSVNENIQNAVFKFMYKNDELKLGKIDRLSIQIPQNGLKDCFNKILLETAELEHRHPLCEQYNIL